MADVDKMVVDLLSDKYETNACKLSVLLKADRLDYIEIDQLIRENERIVELIKSFKEVR